MGARRERTRGAATINAQHAEFDFRPLQGTGFTLEIPPLDPVLRCGGIPMIIDTLDGQWVGYYHIWISSRSELFPSTLSVRERPVNCVARKS